MRKNLSGFSNWLKPRVKSRLNYFDILRVSASTFRYYLMTDSQLSKAEEVAFANYRMDIRYDGQNYYGWQRHKDHPTVQGALENAVTECFGLLPIQFLQTSSQYQTYLS